MEYFEIKAQVILKKDINDMCMYQKLSNLIALSMLKDEITKELHRKNEFKFYCFNGLYPLEADRVYKKNKTYMFNLRSPNKNFIDIMQDVLKNTENEDAKILNTTVFAYYYKRILNLASLTPCVATLNNKSWVKEDELTLLMDRIHSNAVKKYKNYFNTEDEPKENFVESIKLLNKKPIKIPYKNNSLLGNKIIITIKKDAMSQRLAKTVLANGLLEKNGIGMGYMIAK